MSHRFTYQIDKMGIPKYYINQYYFDTINERQAYYLGLLYADGNHYRSNRKYVVRLALHYKDKSILDTFNIDLEHTKPIRSNRNMLEIEISNKYMSNRFLELGLIPNKTFKLVFPTWLDVNLTNHFIRGYFDGDGSIGFYKSFNPRSKTSYRTGRFSIVSTEKFCNSILDIFYKNNLILNCKLKTRFKERNNNTRTIDVGGNIQVKKILDYIYKNATVYLERKYKIYREFYD